MWAEVGGWAIFATGLALGLVAGCFIGATYVLTKFWWKKATRSWSAAREASGRVVKLAGVLALVGICSVLALLGAVSGWWST